MSLEKALEENTKAVKALTAALSEQGNSADTVVAKEEKKTESKKAPAKKAEKKEKVEDKPDYESKKYLEEVKPLTLKTIKAKGREVVADALAKFGDDLKSAKDLTKDQYDDYMAALNAALEEDEDIA
jgi:hypothetical protein